MNEWMKIRIMSEKKFVSGIILKGIRKKDDRIVFKEKSGRE